MEGKETKLGSALALILVHRACHIEAPLPSLTRGLSAMMGQMVPGSGTSISRVKACKGLYMGQY